MINNILKIPANQKRRHFAGLAILGKPGATLPLRLDCTAGALQKAVVKRVVQLKSCQPGQILPPNTVLGECASCEVGKFATVPGERRYQCPDCPEGAICPGLDRVMPIRGWWHYDIEAVDGKRIPVVEIGVGNASNGTVASRAVRLSNANGNSTQIPKFVECAFKGACNGARVIKKKAMPGESCGELEPYPGDMCVNVSFPPDACAQGYTGVACGRCASGYGRGTSSYLCSKCGESLSHSISLSTLSF